MPKILETIFDRLGYVTKAKYKAIAYEPSLKIYGNIGDGIPKPGRISFEQLRKIAKYDSLIRICVNTIKKEVAQSTWDIIPRKGWETTVNQKHVEQATNLFLEPNSNGETLRVLLERILEDLLVLDAATIEKVWNLKGELLELNSVDGATIRPVFNIYGEVDPNYAFVQVINGKTMAEFKKNEMIYIMQNPQNDIMTFGYGLSPIESILLQVQASLNADMYNARSFSEDNIPPGILDLGDMSEDEANRFKALWDATVVGNTQKMKFVWGSNNSKKYIPFQQNNKDMQFVEYVDWLSRIKLAVYGLSTLDANITQDVNRSTAETQYNISNSRGIRSVKKLIEEYFNREILMAMGFNDVVFKFDELPNIQDKKTQAEIDKIYIETGVTDPNEVRVREGQDELDYGVSGDTVEDLEPEGKETAPEETTDETPDATSPQKSFKKKYFKPLYE
jgi:phage portal protein BeeE